MALQLRVERIKRGLTQTRLSALTEIAQSDLSAFENGRRTAGAGQRQRIARALGLPAATLFAPADLGEPEHMR